jgi:hypothetical protein
MLGLPKATELSKALPKKAIFDRFKPSPSDRRLFDEQINRMSIVAEISPQTVAIKASVNVSAVYVVLVTLKSGECDKRNIALLSKLIDQRMLFVLQSGESARLAVYRADKVLISERKPLTDWKMNLSGLDLGAVWENVIARIGGIDIADGKDLDKQLAADYEHTKLLQRIEQLEKRARDEKQPRRKWELAAELKKLKTNL